MKEKLVIATATIALLSLVFFDGYMTGYNTAQIRYIERQLDNLKNSQSRD